MAQVNASPQTTPTPPGAKRPLAVVLFGMPDAGKSSLLGALAQAAQTQEHILNGRLIDRSQTLLELQRRLYEDRPRETLEEVAPHAVTLQPFTPGPEPGVTGNVDAVLMDCDGRVANQLLGGQESLDNRKRALAQAVLNADTLVLVVDAATDASALKRDFGQFAKFLRALEQNRGQRSEVGGLPVYLVLTKCDLLAKPDDTSAAWIDRIEERKRQVDKRFQEFLAQQAEREQMPFGKVDLHLWATAVKRPALADAPARAREPFGIAELFRQCLDSAQGYRDRRAQAARRLNIVLGGIAFVVTAMVLLMLVLVAIQPSTETTALQRDIQSYVSKYPADRPGERLKGTITERVERLEKLRGYQNHPDFGKVPEEYRSRVAADIEDLTEYHKFAENVNNRETEFKNALNPVRGDSETKLAEVKKDLTARRPLPGWSGTEAAQRRQQVLKEVDAVEAERARVLLALQPLVTEGTKLLLARNNILVGDLAEKWDPQARALLNKAAAVTAGIPEDAKKAADVLIPQSEEVTYATLLRLRSVRDVVEAWAGVRKKLEQYVTR